MAGNVAFIGTLISPTDLMAVYIADRAAVGAGTTWNEAFYTLKSSLSIDQAQGAKTETFVDQKAAAINVSYASGSFGFTLRIPDVSNDILGLFYTSEGMAPAQPLLFESGYTATGYSSQIIPSTKMIKFMYKDWGLVFTHVELVTVWKKTGAETFTLDVTGTVLAGDSSAELADFITLTKTP